MRIRQVIDRIRHLVSIVFKAGSTTNLPVSHRLWNTVFVWWPVWPGDEDRLFWLEQVWRRRHPATLQWEYRSFRTEAERLSEAAELARRPPLIH